MELTQPTLKLIKPTIDLKTEYLEMLNDWLDNNERPNPLFETEELEDNGNIVRRFWIVL